MNLGQVIRLRPALSVTIYNFSKYGISLPFFQTKNLIKRETKKDSQKSPE